MARGIAQIKAGKDKRMPDTQTFVVACVRCGVAPQTSAARFCRKCGASLPIELVYTQRGHRLEVAPRPHPPGNLDYGQRRGDSRCVLCVDDVISS
jgi:hypothetical protein